MAQVVMMSNERHNAPSNAFKPSLPTYAAGGVNVVRFIDEFAVRLKVMRLP